MLSFELNTALVVLLPLAAIWVAYMAYGLRNLATIRYWEMIILLPYCSIPVFVVFLIGDLSVKPIWLLIFVGWIGLTFLRKDARKVGSFNHDGQLRILRIGRKKGQIIKNETDLQDIDVLVLSKSDYEKLKSGDSSKLQKLLISAVRLDIEILPISGFLQEEYGYIDTTERNSASEMGLRRRRILRGTKRIVDTLTVLAIFILVLPVVVIICVVLLLFQGRPVFFRQIRLGKGGRSFRIFKFRTMSNDDFEVRRNTRIGTFLRLTHLDEIPQLFNILRGDMAFIGPRPEWVTLSSPELAPENYWLRQAIRPGLTGWAQVVYKPSRTKSMRSRKLGYDLYYVKNRSILLDVLIWLRTLTRLPTFAASFFRIKLRNRSA